MFQACQQRSTHQSSLSLIQPFDTESTLNHLSAGQWHSVGKNIQVPVIPVFLRLELTWDNDRNCFPHKWHRKTDWQHIPNFFFSFPLIISNENGLNSFTEGKYHRDSSSMPTWILSSRKVRGKPTVQKELYSTDKRRVTQLHRDHPIKQAEEAKSTDYWTPSIHSKLVSAGFHPTRHTYTQLSRCIFLL